MHGSALPSVTPEGIPPSATLLDVREPEEWAAGHAPGAVHLPMSQLAARREEIPPGPLAVLCRVGARSADVTAFLTHHGHDAVNVTGGMLAWESSGHPIVAEGDAPARIV